MRQATIPKVHTKELADITHISHMEIDPDEKDSELRTQLPVQVHRKFNAAAAEDGNDQAEELAALLLFREEHREEWDQRTRSRPRRQR
jgi:hypothetical protein